MSQWIKQYLSPDEYHAHRLHGVIASGSTPIQRWEIGDLGPYGRALILDGAIQSAEGDEACYHEALHLPAQVVRQNAKRVLMIGGANGGSLPYILLLPYIEKVVILDIDSSLHASSKYELSHMHRDSLRDTRIEFYFGDPNEVIRASHLLSGLFDIIILDTPDPTQGSYSSRLFGQENMLLLRQLLSDDGILVTQAGQAHPLHCTLSARVFRTFEAVFGVCVPYTANVPSFGTPWAFAATGAHAHDLTSITSAEIKLYADPRRDHLRAYDAETHKHMLAVPLFLRSAWAKEMGRVQPISVTDLEIAVISPEEVDDRGVPT
ncbi:hypothetical protein [Rhodomicrobium sp.]|uniref:spermine/spermidine synthase domain-containing protein n=1 Tax=Rhodomicrobium sp. TaxID=2720632 RepID=UPI0039E3776E